jgi:hypothetical protein
MTNNKVWTDRQGRDKGERGAINISGFGADNALEVK